MKGNNKGNATHRSFCAQASSSVGTSGFASTLSPSISGRSWRDEDRFTKVFSRDLAPTEIVEALEADRLMELASLDFRLPTETSEDFLDVVVGFVLMTGSASLEALLVLFLLVTLTEDVVLTSFCSFDSFRVLVALCLARVAEEDVLNNSFPLTLLLLLLPPA